jgi:hypothetical protein
MSSGRGIDRRSEMFHTWWHSAHRKYTTNVVTDVERTFVARQLGQGVSAAVR